MAIKKLSIKVLPEQNGKRLDQCLAEALPELSKAKVRKLVVAGAVYLNGKRVRIASKEMLTGAKLEAYIDWAKLSSDGRSKDQVFQMSPNQILFEDEDLIVVNKPPGLPTQPTLDEARDNLFAAVKKYLQERAKTADVYLGLHHRLDRDTSGIVLFTKTKRVNAAVADLFSKHLAQKTYQAITAYPTRLKLSDEWTVKNYLGRAPGSGKRARFQEVRSGGDFAETRFRVLGTGSSGSTQVVWLQASPKTGRTHQIRVHLEGMGMPILGDDLYDGPKGLAPRLMLHAARLDFPHPIQQTLVSVQSPLPQDFSSCLASLQITNLSPVRPGQATGPDS